MAAAAMGCSQSSSTYCTECIIVGNDREAGVVEHMLTSRRSDDRLEGLVLRLDDEGLRPPQAGLHGLEVPEMPEVQRLADLRRRGPATAAAEQKEDDDTKVFCTTEIEKAEGEKSDTEEGIASSAAAIEEMEESSATLASEIDSLGKEIKALDKAVAEATEQRKEEHAAFVQTNAEIGRASCRERV